MTKANARWPWAQRSPDAQLCTRRAASAKRGNQPSQTRQTEPGKPNQANQTRKTQSAPGRPDQPNQPSRTSQTNQAAGALAGTKQTAMRCHGGSAAGAQAGTKQTATRIAGRPSVTPASSRAAFLPPLFIRVGPCGRRYYPSQPVATVVARLQPVATVVKLCSGRDLVATADRSEIP